jgi:hypothetical protein
MVLFGVPAFLLGLNALAGKNTPPEEGGFGFGFEGDNNE